MMGLLVLWLALIAALFIVLWLWSAREASLRPPLPMLFIAPAVVGAAAVAYWAIGLNPGTGQWLEEYSANRELVHDMVRGEPDPALEQVPVATLTRVLQRELAKAPSAEGWYGLSLLYTEMQAPAVAITAARKAVQLAPEESAPKLLLARSVIAHADGQLEPEAKGLIDDVLAKQPAHDGAWMMLGMAAMTSADYDTAINAFDELLSRHPEGEAGDALKKARGDALARQKNQSWLDNMKIQVSAAPGIEPGGTLFVFLRKPGDRGQPMAAVRLLADRFPLEVRVQPSNWLQQPPAPGTALVAGARYAQAPGQGVDQAAITAENQPLSGDAGGLSASLELK
ncbi:MAG: cytochrome C biogenesis protein [Alcanivoracaceae bacterium]|nr:cytochrome C biogenesis protein [Alcanivoracaceae bacterium]